MAASFTKLFTDHPASVGESYLQHLISAGRFSVHLIVGGLACFIHALLPFMFVNTARSTVQKLNEVLVLNRSNVSQEELD